MRKNHKYSQNKGLALMILLFISVLGIQSTFATQISIGNMVPSNITGNPDGGPDWSFNLAFDGVIGNSQVYSVSGMQQL